MAWPLAVSDSTAMVAPTVSGGSSASFSVSSASSLDSGCEVCLAWGLRCSALDREIEVLPHYGQEVAARMFDQFGNA